MGGFKSLLSARSAFQSVQMNDFLFPVSDEQRNMLQVTVLNMYKDVLEFSHELELTPFLVGGSALGAIRHNGFIPWDDDLDIGFVRKEYEIFLDEFGNRFKDKYIVNSAGKNKNAKTRFTKIIKNGTLCKEMIAPKDDTLNGIFIDAFPIDNVPNNGLLRSIKGNTCNLLEFISSQVSYFEFADKDTLNLLKKAGHASYFVRKVIGSIFGVKDSSFWFGLVDKVEQYSDDFSEFCSIAPGRKHYFGEMIKRDIIFPARYVDFCGIQAPVFNDVESYLSNMYGDYMKIPPIEKREAHLIKALDFGDNYEGDQL